MQSHGRPVTVMSCDNIPANGVILGNVVRRDRRAARPRPLGLDRRQRRLPVHHGGPHRARRRRRRTSRSWSSVRLSRQRRRRRRAVPPMGDREPVRRPRAAMGSRRRHFRRRRDAVRASQDARAQRRAVRRSAYLGVLAGHEHTSDDIADPLLVAFRPPHADRRKPADAAAGAGRLARSLCRAEPRPPAQHRDPPPQPPDRHRRLAEDRPAPAQSRSASGCGAAKASRCCRSPVAAWMVYLIRASNRFGRSWSADDPYARAGRGDRRAGRQRPDGAGRRNPGDRYDLRPRACGERRVSRRRSSTASTGLLSADPMAYVRRICGEPARRPVEAAAANGIVRGMGRRT